jgi:2-polyprenyl-3-methyl-5-hydroxy-6-metoxy-1,4-benzoquinol methylase
MAQSNEDNQTAIKPNKGENISNKTPLIIQEHYEKKYAHQAGDSVVAIQRVAKPTDRFQAAVKFIPDFFKGGTVLELGAGNGAVAKTLLDMHIGIKSYTLGDISLTRVEGIGKTIRDDRIILRQLNAEDIPESEYGKYDAIVMIALIEHLIDPLRAMQNIRKLLKPTGFIYLDTPNIAKYTRRAQLMLGRFPSTASKNEGLTTYAGFPADLYDEGHLHYFTYNSLSKMLIDRCGFSRIDKLGYPTGRLLFGKQLESVFAKAWPEAFSELVIIAHNGNN